VAHSKPNTSFVLTGSTPASLVLAGMAARKKLQRLALEFFSPTFPKSRPSYLQPLFTSCGY
jgi:hypothetical protein